VRNNGNNCNSKVIGLHGGAYSIPSPLQPSNGLQCSLVCDENHVGLSYNVRYRDWGQVNNRGSLRCHQIQRKERIRGQKYIPDNTPYCAEVAGEIIKPLVNGHPAKFISCMSNSFCAEIADIKIIWVFVVPASWVG